VPKLRKDAGDDTLSHHWQVRDVLSSFVLAFESLSQHHLAAASIVSPPIPTSLQLTSMFDFANIGFSHSRDGVKVRFPNFHHGMLQSLYTNGFTSVPRSFSYQYLSCADCEIGPLGFHDTNITPHTFNVCHARIAYGSS
jgi:hypothetical protein